MGSEKLQFYIRRLSYKPLLIKWFALGVLSGLSPNAIIRSPDIALKFCLENVIDKLDDDSKLVAQVFAHISGAHTPLVVGYLSGLSAETVERSIAKLLQFSLIEDNSKQSFERTYVMGTFARSYLTRIERFNQDEVRRVIERSRKITVSYQVELGNLAINKYSFEHYTVRSHSETIAASDLRRAFRAASRGDIDGGIRIVDALKISSPEYFEVYRVSAAIHVKENDLQGAVSDYETAIDVDPEQPQLYFWYGGFLMRWLDDFDGASKMFMKALELDPNSGAVLREAARNELFARRFEKAQALVDKAMKLEQKSFKDNVIFSDLQAQIYIRMADTLAQAGDFVGAITKLETLRDFVGTLDQSYLDSTFRDHIEKAKRYCTPILLQKAPDNISNRVQWFLEWLDTLLATSGHSDLKRQTHDRRNGIPTVEKVDTKKLRIGQLKKNGQQPTFGFLITEDGIEVFVHRSSMPADVWTALRNGGHVRFRMAVDDAGRSIATDLQRV